MKEKLLSLAPNQWFLLTNRTDRDKITKTLNQLISDREKFVFSDDGERFKRLSCDMFDCAGEPCYKVEKVGIAERLTFRGRLIAIR